MKTQIITLLLSATAFAFAGPEKPEKNVTIYETALDSETKIAVTMSEAPFVAKQHEVGPVVRGDDEDTRSRLAIDGIPAVGCLETDPKLLEGKNHLTRLAVSFNGKIVEAPQKLIAHVFQPSADATFDGTRPSGKVSVSSDGKFVVVDLAAGEGTAAWHRAFTFSDQGECRLGAPPPPSP
jgi:hypothetical protein